MEEKIKKVSVRAFEKAAKSQPAKEVEIDWNGAAVVVKRAIGLSEMLDFVDSVVKTCFNAEDGTYIPEVKDSAIKNNILHYYTNICLPVKYAKRYEWIYCTDIVEAVSKEINEDQLKAIKEAIDEKLLFIAKERIDVITRQVNDVQDALAKLLGKFEDAFSDVKKDDISTLVRKLADNEMTDEALIRAVVDNRRKDRDAD